MTVDASKLETTLVLIKPDAIQRRLVGRILQRFEEKGLQIVAAKMLQIPRALAEQQYAAHKGKPFYGPLVRFMTDHPVVALAFRGRDAVSIVRAMCGATFGSQAEPGTIRGDFAVSNRFNLIHAADSPETAAQELAIYFKPEEILDSPPADFNWTYDTSTGEIV